MQEDQSQDHSAGSSGPREGRRGNRPGHHLRRDASRLLRMAGREPVPRPEHQHPGGAERLQGRHRHRREVLPAARRGGPEAAVQPGRQSGGRSEEVPAQRRRVQGDRRHPQRSPLPDQGRRPGGVRPEGLGGDHGPEEGPGAGGQQGPGAEPPGQVLLLQVRHGQHRTGVPDAREEGGRLPRAGGHRQGRLGLASLLRGRPDEEDRPEVPPDQGAVHLRQHGQDRQGLPRPVRLLRTELAADLHLPSAIVVRHVGDRVT
ncbi:hypothetical protein SGPA1_21775 [Streptomyces misionensis JCM 4497]